MKQILLFILVLLPIVASADESGTCGENLTWVYEEATNKLIISGTGEMYGYSAGLSPWDEFKDDIQTLMIGDGVTSIGNQAFYSCSNISSVIIPDGVTTIGRAAFWNCVRLESFKIGKDVNTIGRNAFQGCISLASIDIPDGVKELGRNAFYGCENLFSVTMGSGLTTIGERTFSGCIKLYSISIGTNVTTIHSYAFGGCENLSQLKMNSSVSYIGDHAFEGCRSLKSISLPNTLESICNFAFGECEGISILYIPESVSYIANGAFSGCRGLISIVVDENNSKYDSRDNCNAIIETSSNTLITGCYTTQIPNSVTSLGDGCFMYSNITTLYIPSSITKIEGNSFTGCSDLSQITIPSSVSYIGFAAFAYCTSLASIIIPDGINSIELSTFEGCIKLGNVELGSGITTVKPLAFKDCQSLTMFTCRADSPPTISFDYGSSAFTNTILSNINGFVPAASVELYKQAIPWKYFGKIRAIGNYFNVKITSKGNGQIEYGSNVIRNTSSNYEVESKEGVHMAIVPDEGNSLKSFCINGKDMGNNLVFSIDNLVEDIDIAVSFAANKYTLKYIIDNVEYKTVEYEYGSSITPELEPTKEGYTFSGWSDIPETMPANDVTVTGSFIVNKYQITYIIDGEVFSTEYVEYGATIVPPIVEEKEGFTFSGWAEVPESMPAHDITIYGNFTSGIAEIVMETKSNVRIYSPNGKKIGKLQKGLNVVVLEDGTVKKIIVR